MIDDYVDDMGGDDTDLPTSFFPPVYPKNGNAKIVENKRFSQMKPSNSVIKLENIKKQSSVQERRRSLHQETGQQIIGTTNSQAMNSSLIDRRARSVARQGGAPTGGSMCSNNDNYRSVDKHSSFKHSASTPSSHRLGNAKRSQRSRMLNQHNIMAEQRSFRSAHESAHSRKVRTPVSDRKTEQQPPIDAEDALDATMNSAAQEVPPGVSHGLEDRMGHPEQFEQAHHIGNLDIRVDSGRQSAGEYRQTTKVILLKGKNHK